MKKREIENIIKKSFKKLKKLQQVIVLNFNAEEIHNFRVEVKKLRALLRLLNTKKVTGTTLPILLKSFYRNVGILRNIQLHEKNLRNEISKEHTNLYAYFICLDEEKNILKKEIIEMMKNKNFSSSENLILKGLPKKLTRSLIKKFNEKKIVRLNNMLTKIKDEKTLHEIRKCLKDLFYNLSYLANDKALPKIILKKEKFKDIIDNIGSIIDEESQIKLLQERYLNVLKNQREKKNLIDIQLKLINKKNSLMKAVNEKLEKLEAAL